MNPMGNCFLKKRNTGLGKRGPPTELSREAYERGHDQESTLEATIPGDKICTPEEIKKRKILKIRRKGDRKKDKILKPVENKKKGLTLNSELPKEPETNNNFFGNSGNNQGQVTGLFTNNKEEDEPKGWVPQKTDANIQSDIDNGGASFFGNGKKSESGNKKVDFKQQGSSLFASNTEPVEKKQEQKKKVVQTGSMFASNNQPKEKKKEVKEENKNQIGSLFGTSSGGLFGDGEIQTEGLFKNKNSEDDDKTTSGLFSNTDNGKAAPDSNKVKEKKEVQSTGLFSNIETKDEEKKPKGGFFENISEKKGGLFGETNSGSGGMFGNPSSGGLFGDNQEEKKTSGGLFAEVQEDDEKKDEDKGGFFGNDNEEKEEGGGLFGDLQTSGGGLFAGLTDPNASNNTKGLNIFSEQVKSSGLFADNQNGEQSSEPVDKEVKINKAFVKVEIDPNKKFKYEEKTQTLFTGSVSNFKVNKVPGFGNGTVAIEKFNENNTVCLIFRNPAHAILSNTIIMKGLSVKGYMKGKSDAVYVYTFRQGEDKVNEEGEVISKGGIERCQCKMAFTDGEDKAKEFMKTVGGLI